MPWAAAAAAGVAGLGSALSPGGAFGSSPSVNLGSQSTLSPAQQALQNYIAQYLQGGISSAPSSVSNVTPYSGQFTAPLDPQQLQLLSSIFGPTGAGGTLSTAQAGDTAASNALNAVLSGQPQDFSQYFQSNVAQPMEQTFSQQTLPAIKAAFARSAGGTYSGNDNTVQQGPGTGYQGAVGTAGNQLTQSLGQAATSLATTGETQALQRQVQGLGLAPSVTGAPLTQLLSTLGLAGLPQQNQQSNLTATYNDYLRQIQQLQGLISPAAGTVGLSSVSPYQIVNPGAPGFTTQLLTSLLSGSGGQGGLATLLASNLIGGGGGGGLDVGLTGAAAQGVI